MAKYTKTLSRVTRELNNKKEAVSRRRIVDTFAEIMAMGPEGIKVPKKKVSKKEKRDAERLFWKFTLLTLAGKKATEQDLIDAGFGRIKC